MMNTKSFYTVIAHNNVGNIEFKASYMDVQFASQIFYDVVACADCHDAVMMDGTTGEIVIEYDKDAE